MNRNDVHQRLVAAGLDPDEVWRAVETGLSEDLRHGPDATSRATVATWTTVRAEVRARHQGVLAGVPVALAVLTAMKARFQVDVVVDDGHVVHPGDVLLRIEGLARPLFAAERTMLNLMCHLSGIATLTRTWVDEVTGTGSAIRDTRKTLPGLRTLQKYAVRCGGGRNHRLGLGDALLIKDNHIASFTSLAEAVYATKATAAGMPLQVECDTIGQVREAIAVGVDSILLDNMTLDEVGSAVQLARQQPEYVFLEASGGIRLDQARDIAETGVDALAVGALTHSSPALDLGLDVTGWARS